MSETDDSTFVHNFEVLLAAHGFGFSIMLLKRCLDEAEYAGVLRHSIIIRGRKL